MLARFGNPLFLWHDRFCSAVPGFNGDEGFSSDAPLSYTQVFIFARRMSLGYFWFSSPFLVTGVTLCAQAGTDLTFARLAADLMDGCPRSGSMCSGLARD